MNDFVVAECAIRQLHARYIDAVWRKDKDAFAACYAEDGEWKIAGLHLRGRTDIRNGFERLLSACQRVLITVGTPLLELGQGTAVSRVHVNEYAKLTDGSAARTIGIYYDRYVAAGDRWLFKSRHWNVAYRGPADFSAAFIECPDYGPHPGMPSPDEPPMARASKP